jgi:hypothetical protein
VHSGAQSFLFHHVLELPFMRSFLWNSFCLSAGCVFVWQLGCFVCLDCLFLLWLTLERPSVNCFTFSNACHQTVAIFSSELLPVDRHFVFDSSVSEKE